MRTPLIIDGRNLLDGERCRRCRLRLRGRRPPVGRHPRPSTETLQAPAAPARPRNRSGPMQAVILSGGQGTRLRPLTSTMPKPAVPMVNRPMLWYMIDWLRLHGVEEVVMSMGLQGRRPARGARRGRSRRRLDHLRRRARAAGHRGRRQVRRAASRRALPRAQRRHARRLRPLRRDRPARAPPAPAPRSRWFRSRTRPPTASS